MIQVASGTRVYLACAPLGMRLGVPGLCAAVARILNSDPFSGSLFIFRSKKGNYLKIVYFDGSAVCLFAKKMERHRFIWPRTVDAQLSLSPAQMSLLIEGIDWRRTVVPDDLPRPALI